MTFTVSQGPEDRFYEVIHHGIFHEVTPSPSPQVRVNGYCRRHRHVTERTNNLPRPETVRTPKVGGTDTSIVVVTVTLGLTSPTPLTTGTRTSETVGTTTSTSCDRLKFRRSEVRVQVWSSPSPSYPTSTPYSCKRRHGLKRGGYRLPNAPTRVKPSSPYYPTYVCACGHPSPPFQVGTHVTSVVSLPRHR